MTDMFTQRPPDHRRSIPPLAEGEPWLTLWRAYWIDLPLAWAGAMDAFLHGWSAPAIEAPAHSRPSAPARALREPATSAAAIALGFGCGDYADEALDDACSQRKHGAPDAADRRRAAGAVFRKGPQRFDRGRPRSSGAGQ